MWSLIIVSPLILSQTLIWKIYAISYLQYLSLTDLCLYTCTLVCKYSVESQYCLFMQVTLSDPVVHMKNQPTSKQSPLVSKKTFSFDAVFRDFASQVRLHCSICFVCHCYLLSITHPPTNWSLLVWSVSVVTGQSSAFCSNWFRWLCCQLWTG